MSDILKVTFYKSDTDSSHLVTDIMVAWSSSLYLDVDSSSSDDSVKLSLNKGSAGVDNCLKCYVCDEYFEKPRILPCGHTYCEKCVLSLREMAVHEFNKSRDPNAHRRGDCGLLTCPWPNCHYTMRIMNVSRWTLKNKAMSRAVAAARRQEKGKRNIGSQTHIDGSSVIVSLPAKLFLSSPTQITAQRAVPTSPTATVVQHVLQNVFAMDTLDVKHCKPPDYNGTRASNWKDFAYMFGMAIIDQVIKMT